MAALALSCGGKAVVDGGPGQGGGGGSEPAGLCPSADLVGVALTVQQASLTLSDCGDVPLLGGAVIASWTNRASSDARVRIADNRLLTTHPPLISTQLFGGSTSAVVVEAGMTLQTVNEQQPRPDDSDGLCELCDRDDVALQLTFEAEVAGESDQAMCTLVPADLVCD